MKESETSSRSDRGPQWSSIPNKNDVFVWFCFKKFQSGSGDNYTTQWESSYMSVITYLLKGHIFKWTVFGIENLTDANSVLPIYKKFCTTFFCTFQHACFKLTLRERRSHLVFKSSSEIVTSSNLYVCDARHAMLYSQADDHKKNVKKGSKGQKNEFEDNAV